MMKQIKTFTGIHVDELDDEVNDFIAEVAKNDRYYPMEVQVLSQAVVVHDRVRYMYTLVWIED